MSTKLKDRLLLRFVSSFGWLIVNLLCSTVKLKIEGEEILDYYYNQGKRVIFTFWHDTQLFFVYYYRQRDIQVLISASKDGEYIARTIEKLGFKAIRGSSSKGGMRALLKLVNLMQKGKDGGFTPDGPRGPRHILKDGVLLLSQKTQSPIIPITFSSDKKKVFNSWDKFMIPGFFSKGVLLYGKPFIIPKNCSKEEFENYRVEVEAELNRIWEKADNYKF